MQETNIENKEYKSFFMKVLIILGVIVGILFLYKISNIIFILIFSLFLTLLFSPLLNRLNKYKINDLFGIIMIFLIILFVILIVIFSIIPLVVNQSINGIASITDSINNLKEIYTQKGIEGFGLPYFIEDAIKNLNITQILDLIKENTSQIGTFLGNNMKNFITSGAGIIFSVTNALFNFVLIFIFTFFIVLERKSLRKFFYSILPKNIAVYIHKNEGETIKTLSEWLKGQLILGLAMFVLTLVGLLILKLFGININGIFTLALVAGFMEFIPYVGTFVSIALALTVSLGSGVEAFIGVLIVYLIIQQIEGNLLVPYIMGKTLSLSPFSVLISMLIGGALFGIIGIIFTIPVLCILQIFLRPYLERRKKENIFLK